MINLFRKIKQQLSIENKIIKYLLYGIGEIILIVIGILLALSINKWNDNQNNIKTEKIYLINIIKDLKVDSTEYQLTIKYHQESLENTNYFLTKFKKNEDIVENDFIESYLYHVESFVCRNLTYKEMESSGKLNLIRNLDVRNEILDYYKYVSTLEHVQESNNNIGVGLSTPLLNQIDFNSIAHIKNSSIIEVDPFELSFFNENRSDSKFKGYQNILSWGALLSQYNIRQLKEGLNANNKLKYQIKEYLNTVI